MTKALIIFSLIATLLTIVFLIENKMNSKGTSICPCKQKRIEKQKLINRL